MQNFITDPRLFTPEEIRAKVLKEIKKFGADLYEAHKLENQNESLAYCMDASSMIQAIYKNSGLQFGFIFNLKEYLQDA